MLHLSCFLDSQCKSNCTRLVSKGMLFCIDRSVGGVVGGTREDFALACKLAARSMSGSSRAKASDAFAVSDISKVDRDCDVHPLDLSKETASSSDPSSFSIRSRKSSVLANLVVTVPVD